MSPPRTLLSFRDVCARLRCSEDDLHYLIADGKIRPAAFVTGEGVEQWLARSVADADGGIEFDSHLVESDGIPLYVRPGRLLFLHRPIRRSLSQYSFRFFFDSADNFPLEIEDYPAEGVTLYIGDSGIARTSEEAVEHFVFPVEYVNTVEAALSAHAPTGRGRDVAGARERSTLLKLVLGMAIKGYGFDPAAKRNPAIADIAKHLMALGMPVSDDTIRGYLKEAVASQYPDRPAGHFDGLLSK